MSDDAKTPAEEPEVIEFTVPEHPAYSDAETFLTELRSLPEGATVALNAEGVAEMTASYVYAVVSLSKTLTAAGGKVLVDRPTAAFIDAFSDLNMFQDLMKMEFRQ
ncbi:MAG: hypothetical protein AAGH74_03475 [Pseudomonadota bacterium]